VEAIEGCATQPTDPCEPKITLGEVRAAITAINKCGNIKAMRRAVDTVELLEKHGHIQSRPLF
jgi:hypothetical protein